MPHLLKDSEAMGKKVMPRDLETEPNTRSFVAHVLSRRSGKVIGPCELGLVGGQWVWVVVIFAIMKYVYGRIAGGVAIVHNDVHAKIGLAGRK